MGMLGALAGAGRGLSDYSAMLNEKAKMDWHSQEAAIRYEREKSLESLRMQNQRSNVEYADKLATTRQGQQNEFQVERYGIEKEDRQSQIKYADDLARQRAKDEYSDEAIAGKSKLLAAEASIKQGAAVNQAVAIANVTFDLDKKKRAEKLEEIKSSEMYKKSSDENKMLIEASVMQPEVAKVYIESMKATQREIPFEQARLAIKDGVDRYETLDEDQRKSFKKQLKVEFGKTFSDEDAATLMGRMNLESVMEATGKGKPTTSTKQNTGVSPEKFGEYSKQIQGALNSGQLSLGEAKERTKGTQFESVVSDWEMNSRNKPSSGGSAIGSVLSDVKGFATRNVEGGDNRLLEQLKKRYPNMTDEFYKLKLQQMR